MDDLLNIQARYLQTVRDARTSGLILEITASLVGRPYVTIPDLVVRTGKTFVTANNAVAKLVDLGILQETTGRPQDRVFVASAVVDVLTRPAAR